MITSFSRDNLNFWGRMYEDPTNPFMNGGQSMANDAAHELSATITDPFISTWYDQSGAEVGGKCQTQYGSPIILSGWD